MSRAQRNAETLRRFLDRLNETGEPPTDLVHPDLEIHMFEGSPIRGPYHGHEGLRRWRDDTFDVLEEWRLELDEVVEGVDPDLLVAIERFVGRARYTDLEADFPLAVVVRFRDGLILGFHGYRERAEALEAVGATRGAAT